MTTIQPASPVSTRTREAKVNEDKTGIVIVQSAVRIEEVTHVRPQPILPSEPVLTPQYPTWPTSQPGPMVVVPPFGQHPHPVRSDQMLYEHYDQEHGRAFIPAVARPIVPEHRGKVYLSDVDGQDVKSDTVATQRWLDDGGYAYLDVGL
ncbi:hypothetical protein KDW_48240 [Dictyobacter vulcani]|uniref:Uncharacterized protein n=1 Tax=Dictyobacter vulcani TaxID=2607529 RepID=A0A5J4KU02_9CHLR|nr:hypothetical protein [Dictyobacter vulcani]GER90662.1 hypothetical protein KDW_48240 [Dictyobacter vulcani]